MTQNPTIVQFQTVDDVTIVADWYPVVPPRWGALLLHMMPADRTSWAAFASLLREHAMASLAIDLRGHGASVVQGATRLSYETFTDTEHQASANDLAASVAWLGSQGVASERTFLVGASIGANLALQYLVDHPHIPAACLLSPGENYHGIAASPLVDRLAPHQRLLLIAGRDDAESAAAVEELDRRTRGRHKKIMLAAVGHGTTMLTEEQPLMGHILQWMEETQEDQGGEKTHESDRHW